MTVGQMSLVRTTCYLVPCALKHSRWLGETAAGDVLSLSVVFTVYTMVGSSCWFLDRAPQKISCQRAVRTASIARSNGRPTTSFNMVCAGYQERLGRKTCTTQHWNR